MEKVQSYITKKMDSKELKEYFDNLRSQILNTTDEVEKRKLWDQYIIEQRKLKQNIEGLSPLYHQDDKIEIRVLPNKDKIND